MARRHDTERRCDGEFDGRRWAVQNMTAGLTEIITAMIASRQIWAVRHDEYDGTDQYGLGWWRGAMAYYRVYRDTPVA
tara:strand:- start:831 stop:1064 length:234 start_codon:yes stop_codon:yes gene_type:complete